MTRLDTPAHTCLLITAVNPTCKDHTLQQPAKAGICMMPCNCRVLIGPLPLADEPHAAMQAQRMSHATHIPATRSACRIPHWPAHVLEAQHQRPQQGPHVRRHCRPLHLLHQLCYAGTGSLTHCMVVGLGLAYVIGHNLGKHQVITTCGSMLRKQQQMPSLHIDYANSMHLVRCGHEVCLLASEQQAHCTVVP